MVDYFKVGNKEYFAVRFKGDRDTLEQISGLVGVPMNGVNLKTPILNAVFVLPNQTIDIRVGSYLVAEWKGGFEVMSEKQFRRLKRG